MPERSIDKPFRMSISDIYKGTTSGLCVYGRVETGVLRANDKILVCPLKEQATVKNITIDDVARSSFAGDHVAVTLSGVDVSNISVGCILCKNIFNDNNGEVSTKTNRQPFFDYCRKTFDEMLFYVHFYKR